jgi:hypothetical protein
MSEPDICIRRAPGTCCPEPDCDYVHEHPINYCGSCGKNCKNCGEELAYMAWAEMCNRAAESQYLREQE